MLTNEFDLQYNEITVRKVPPDRIDRAEWDPQEHDGEPNPDYDPETDGTSTNINPISVEIELPFHFCYGSAIVRTFPGNWGGAGNDGNTEILLDLSGMQIGDRTWVHKIHYGYMEADERGRLARNDQRGTVDRVRIHVKGDSERLQLSRLFRAISDYLYSTNTPKEYVQT